MLRPRAHASIYTYDFGLGQDQPHSHFVQALAQCGPGTVESEWAVRSRTAEEEARGLVAAAINGRTDIWPWLLEQQPDLNRPAHGAPPLWWAIKHGHWELALWFLPHVARIDPTLCGPDGRNYSHLLADQQARWPHDRRLQWLAQGLHDWLKGQGSALAQHTWDGLPAQPYHPERVLQHPLNRGRGVDFSEAHLRWAQLGDRVSAHQAGEALSRAAESNHTAAVMGLLAQGADPNVPMTEGLTGWAHAARSGWTEVVQAYLPYTDHLDLSWTTYEGVEALLFLKEAHAVGATYDHGRFASAMGALLAHLERRMLEASPGLTHATPVPRPQRPRL